MEIGEISLLSIVTAVAPMALFVLLRCLPHWFTAELRAN